jgi:putative flippase GtrA
MFSAAINKTPRPLRYILSGGSAALVNFSLLALLVEAFGLWYLAAAVIAFTIALLASFTLQKFFTFSNHARSKHILTRQFVVYATIALANIAINTLIVYLLVELLSFHYLLAQVVSSATIALYSFFIYRALFQGALLPQEGAPA